MMTSHSFLILFILCLISSSIIRLHGYQLNSISKSFSRSTNSFDRLRLPKSESKFVKPSISLSQNNAYRMSRQMTVSNTMNSILNSKLKIIKLFISLSAVIFNPVLGGGFLSGGLHAITGPDHLAAILPSSIGQKGFTGMRLGALWGLGHGFSAIFIGLIAFFVRGQVSSRFKYVERLSSLAEQAVGFSLIAIGGLGLKENLMTNPGNHEEFKSSSASDGRAVFANGILHGFSWDGAPSLAPALALSSWQSVLAFLLSYCFGTMIMMSVTSGILSEGSTRLGNAINDPNFPKKLSIVSSIIAILIGVFWICK